MTDRSRCVDYLARNPAFPLGIGSIGTNLFLSIPINFFRLYLLFGLKFSLCLAHFQTKREPARPLIPKPPAQRQPTFVRVILGFPLLICIIYIKYVLF